MERYPTGGEGIFQLGDIQALLPELMEKYAGKAQLIYLDPPFATGDTFQFRIDGKQIKKTAYTDKLSQEEYLGFMRQVLTGCHTILAPEGSLYLHVDYRMAARLRILLDDIFGEANHMNEIIWMYKSGGRSTKHFSRKHDTILFYRKSKQVYFDISAVGVKRGPERRNHMRRFMDEDGRICYSIRSGGKTYVYHEDMPIYPSDVWIDIEHLHQRDPERNGYATQKPEALLRRILLASSPPNGLVMDFFSGSGTTAAVAAQTGRRFFVCDSSPYALFALRRRLVPPGAPVSMLKKSAPFTLRYPEQCPHIGAQATLETKGGVWYATITSEQPLLYSALGFIEQSAFTPVTCSYTPTPAHTLRMALSHRQPVLHLVDLDGNQGFWEI